MKIACNIVTDAIVNLARQIGRSESYTCNLVSVWQTQNNSAGYPTASQLNELLKSNKEQAWEIYLAVPNYEVREYNPSIVPIEHVNGQIYLMRLPKNKPMEHFYEMYKNLPELRELAVTPEEAYRFILWREMAFMQHGLSKKPENRPVAEGEAIKKAREWRKRHPIQMATEVKPQQSTVNPEYKQITSEMSINDVYNQLKSQYAPNSSESKLTDLVFSALKDTGVIFKTANLPGSSGKYVASENTILYNPNALQNNTLIHEAIHAVTSYYLKASNKEGFSNEIKAAIKEIEECYELLKQDFIETHFYENGKPAEGVNINKAFDFWIQQDDLYGYTSPEEMVAELSKPSFVEHIKDFDRRHKGKNIFQKLVDNIAKLFGINKSYSSLESTVKKALVTLLTNPSKELMERYAKENATIKNNVKQLRESKHVHIQNKLAVSALIAKVEAIPSEELDYADVVLDIKEEQIPYSFTPPEGIKVGRLSALHKGTIFGYVAGEQQLFMTYNGNASKEDNIAHIPVRIYSWRGLSTNDFIIKKDDNGLDYVESINSIFPTSQTTQQSAQQQSLPGPETKINIYAGTGENADLSNFAERPVDVSEGEVSDIINRYVGKAFKAKFKTVEGAFQAMKIFFSSEGYTESYIPQGGLPTIGITKKGDQMLTKFENASGSQARSLGRQINGLDKDKWDKVSSVIMKALLKASFEQNPQALQRLLATGNATLTHTQDKGKWGKEFPKLLMEVREELRQATTSQVQPTPQQKATISFSVEDATEGKPQPQVVTKEDTNNVYKVPEIGTDVVKVDPNNSRTRLAEDFTAMERHDRVVMLARNFSNIVDRAVEEKIQENADAISEEMSKDEPDMAEIARLRERASLLNDSVKGRRAVMQDKTIQQIFQQMRKEIESYTKMTPEELDKDYGEGRGEYLLNAYQKVLDNWDALLADACVIIESTEKVRVVIDRHAYNTGTSTKTVTGGTMMESTQDTDDKKAAFGDDENGKRVEGNGGWSYKARFVDPRTSLSMGVKRVLANIKREGINGEPEVDDLGNIRYIDAEFAHAALINGLSGMIDSDDFSVKNDDGTYSFPALERVAEKYPWANQVINALQAEPTLISSFYADFRKDFIPYWMQYFDKKEDKWKTVPLNKPVALDSMMTNIINNYEQGTILDTDSVYQAGRKLNKEKASLGVKLTTEVQSALRYFDKDSSEEVEEVGSKVTKALRMLGVNTTIDVVNRLINSQDGIVSLEKVTNSMRSIFEKVNKGLKEDEHLIQSLKQDYQIIAEEVGLVSELDNIQSFRDRNGDTRYSYSAPNYLNTLFKTLKSDERRDAYLQRQFGRYNWFKNQKTGKWRNEWLRLIETDEDVRDQMELKELIDIDGVEYTDWKPLQIKSAFVREYFSVGYNKGSKKQFALYNIPIFSDSPVAVFIKFLRYTSDSQHTFKDKLMPLFNQLVKQELSRIKLVQERWEKGVSPIANFDITREEDIRDKKKGYRFHFFPELNTYNNGTFLDEAMALTKAKDVDGLNKLINGAVTEIMNQNFESFLHDNFDADSYKSLEENLLSEGVITSESQFEGALEEYFWNQAYATSQIIELTTTDLAYYKDGVDFQKRFKEVYAAGTKLNTNSQYGRKTERTIYLEDQIVTSSGYHDIKVSLDRAVQLGHIQSFDRDNILHMFREINVADAQAYRSISSMRAVLDMLGAWTPEMQKAVAKFDPKFDPDNSENKEGESNWTMADFNIIWQTIKPFVFTQIEKPDGLGGVIKVPHQNKNSEFLLLSMYQMVANSMGGSPKLKAINRFMEDNNIDVIQFESAVKVGKQGIININYSEPKLQAWKKDHEKEWKEIEKAAKTSGSDYSVFKAGNDYLLDHDKISQEEYNNRFEAIEPLEQDVYDILSDMSMQNGEFKPEVVHEIPYSDYVVQQPTPEHLIDCAPVVFGSQFRNLVISDMPDDPNFRVKVNGKELTKQQVLNLYQSLIVENLLEDWEKVKGKFADIRSLQEAMLDAVKGNPKYGRDMLDALQIVEVTNPLTEEKQEVFNIPLDNPSTTAKIQELITSMFKNAITEQHIKGGSCILVSDFGFTEELHLIHGKDGSIQGIECYLPAYSKQFYEPFMVTKVDNKGNKYQELDINKMPMELRRIIGYRIPTEDKYSMAPLIIKGFLPQQNGSCIMLPADITRIAGSDFDVDKMFLMIPEFYVQEYDKARARKDFAKMNDIFRTAMSPFSETELAKEVLAEDTNDFNIWYEDNKENYRYDTPRVRKIKYDMGKSAQEQSRAARNNMIIDVAWGILTHPDTAEKIHNPGSFDKAKIAARIATIISDPRLLYNFAGEQGLMYPTANAEDDYDFDRKQLAKLLLKMSKEGKLDELDSFIKRYKAERSQLTVDTFIYNHRQNMTGGALIGMYANNTTMQAKFQATGLSIKDDYVFTINGRIVKSLHDIMSPNGERISKNCANFSAASVDNVKDPVLADLMQNTETANVAGFMLRAGMSIEEVGLLFSQPVVRRCITETGGLDGLDGYIKGMIDTLKQNGGGVSRKIQLHDFTSEELILNAINDFQTEMTEEELNDLLASQIQAGLLMKHIAAIAEDLSDLTKISRADSPNGAISISIAGAKNQIRKVDLYARRTKTKWFTLTGLDDIMQNKYVTADMSREQMREKLLKSKMPMLQTFYSLGIELGSQVMGQYFSQTTPYSDALVEQLQDNSPKGSVSDDILNDFYSELVEFALSKTKMLGDDGNATFDEKRDYYLYDFPKEYLRVLAANPDIANMSIFKKMQVKDGDIVMDRSGRLTPMMRETLMRNFDMLLNSDNPVAQKLAIDLFMYSYYKDGFKFGPNNFGTFFSSNFISSFPEFVKALRELRFNMQSGTYFDDYLPQFYANHWQDPGLVPKIDMMADVIEIDNGQQIAVNAKSVLNKNLLGIGKTKSYPMIAYTKTIKNPDGELIEVTHLYSLSQDGSDRAIYTLAVEMSDSQKGKRGVKYNANMTALEMADVETDKARIEANAALNPSSSSNSSSNSESLPNFEIGIKKASDDDFGGFTGGMNMESALTSMEEKYSEAGGQAQLKDELCK